MTKYNIESDLFRIGIGISWDSTRMRGEAGTPLTATRWENLAPAERERLVNFFKTHAQKMSSPTDDWEECAFEDIQKGDRVRMVQAARTTDFHLPVIETHGTFLVLQDNTQCSNFHKAVYYRIPATVVAPDPEQHPVIYVKECDIVGFIPKIMVWYRDSYVAGQQCLSPEQITDWQHIDPTKVVETNA